MLISFLLQPNHVGIINLGMRLKDVVERWADFVTRLAHDKYGKAPRIKLSGHINATFPYIQLPLDYIFPELLKNAVRATIESHEDLNDTALPPIQITIANNDVDFIVRYRCLHICIFQYVFQNFASISDQVFVFIQDIGSWWRNFS